MVSVIIPTHNRREFAREAIVSVLSQRDAVLELIVVDDGSDDDTASMVAGFGEGVRCLRTPHRGVSAARNVGILASRGGWIAFLDSDDLWLPDKLRVQMQFLASRPEYRICQTEEIWIRNGQRINPRKYHRKPEGHCFERLLDRCLVSPSAVVMERSLLDEVGLFDENLPACEDYDLWLRIGCRHPLGLVRKPLVVKRGGHGDQLSSVISSLDRWRIKALENVLKSGRLTEAQAHHAMSVLREKCRVYGGGCVKRGRREEGGQILSLPARLSVLLGSGGERESSCS
ncbi:MAG: glycosyltransferase [Syntrophobacteraceae bacterium]|jgi:glycosyltransferase involved in cell wall biosynthesis|nr:glycosyltransferase [Syntrophobacteraceae bacterium]